LCSSLALALLVCSLILVPQSTAYGQPPGSWSAVLNLGCSGNFACDSGCTTRTTFCYLWPLITGGCSATPPPGNTCAGCRCYDDPILANWAPCNCIP